jgi:hypothetical protein
MKMMQRIIMKKFKTLSKDRKEYLHTWRDIPFSRRRN